MASLGPQLNSRLQQQPPPWTANYVSRGREASESGGSSFQVLRDTQAVSSTALASTVPEALLTKDTKRLRYSMSFSPQSSLIISLQESQAPETSREDSPFMKEDQVTEHSGHTSASGKVLLAS